MVATMWISSGHTAAVRHNPPTSLLQLQCREVELLKKNDIEEKPILELHFITVLTL